MRIATLDQLLETLDRLFDDGSDWTRQDERDPWAEILSRPDHPLTSSLPDANLLGWQVQGLLPDAAGQRALDLGCGLGRNSRWLATQGYRVTGVDLSPYAVHGARQRSAGLDTVYLERDLLREAIPGGPFALVYDSGCFHHLPPHRRLSYLETLERALVPGGLFGICTFAPGKMGSEADDLTLLRRGRLEGGIAYSVEDLRAVFSTLELLDGGALPPPQPEGPPVFWMDFLNAALFRRPGAGP